MESIKIILMRRDKISSNEAEKIIQQARTQLYEYIKEGKTWKAENICEEFFALEPDYIVDLL